MLLYSNAGEMILTFTFTPFNRSFLCFLTFGERKRGGPVGVAWRGVAWRVRSTLQVRSSVQEQHLWWRRLN